MNCSTQPLLTGGQLAADASCIRCVFPNRRLALSTSLYNGGYHLVSGVFNHHLDLFVDSEHDLPGGSLAAYLADVAVKYQMIPAQTSGLITAAAMNCMAYAALSYRGLSVEVITTAGTKNNAARAGDPACYYEDNGEYQLIAGTINIIALINAVVPEGPLAKAIVTITEAKAAALADLNIPSCYSAQVATGTGTDGVIVVSNPAAALTCVDTGTQAKLGELLSQAVDQTLKKSVALAGDI